VVALGGWCSQLALKNPGLLRQVLILFISKGAESNLLTPIQEKGVFCLMRLVPQKRLKAAL
jgi:hypothetical protein